MNSDVLSYMDESDVSSISLGVKNLINRSTKWKNKSNSREAKLDVLLTNIDLINYCQEFKENAKSLNDPNSIQ